MEVVDPSGRALRVPIEWTDRSGALAPVPLVTTVTAGTPQLLALAQLVINLREAGASVATFRDAAKLTTPSPAPVDGPPTAAPSGARAAPRGGGPARRTRRGPRTGGTR